MSRSHTAQLGQSSSHLYQNEPAMRNMHQRELNRKGAPFT